MKTTYTLLLIFVIKMMAAQSDSNKIYRNQIKLSPVRLITVVRGIQMSVERQFTNKISTQITAAYMTNVFYYHFLDIKKLKGYTFGIEQKYYLNNTEESADYLALDATFLNCSFEKVYSFTQLPANDSLNTLYYDTIGVNRKTFTFSFKYGFQYYFNRLVMDLNIGLGVRYRDINYTNELHEDGVWATPMRIEPTVTYKGLLVKGQYFTFNVPVGLKIGYRF